MLSSSSASLSLLQNKDLLQPSPLISISCPSVPGYFNKTSYFISPSSSLLALPYFTIQGLSIYYFNSQSIICSTYYMPFPWPSVLLIVIMMSSTLVCSLIHDALFLSLHSSLGTWSFCSRAFVRLQVSCQYVKTGRMHWL